MVPYPEVPEVPEVPEIKFPEVPVPLWYVLVPAWYVDDWYPVPCSVVELV